MVAASALHYSYADKDKNHGVRFYMLAVFNVANASLSMKTASSANVWPLGEGAAKPGIEWPEGTQSALAGNGSLFGYGVKCFIPLGASIPLAPFSKGEQSLSLIQYIK